MLSWNFFIFALFPILIAIWYFIDYKKLGQSYPNSIIAKYCKNHNKKNIIWIMRCLIIFFLLAIIGNIKWQYIKTESKPEPHLTTIILDISRSMLAEDITPNRMTVAKNALKNFVESRKDDHFTLIIFAGKAFTVISHSNDQAGILQFLESIHTDYIMQAKPWLSGTNIGDAILLGANENKKNNSKKNIILITDGSANIGSDPLESTKLAINENISIYTIGIGTKTNIPLSYTDINGQKNYFYDQNGEKIITDLDDELLKKIAENTGGIYSTAENMSALNEAFEKTTKDIGNTFIEKTETKTTSLTPIFIIFLIIFLWCEKFFEKKFYLHYKILQ